MRRAVFPLFLPLLAACASMPPPRPAPVAQASRIVAIAFSSDGTVLHHVTRADNRCTLNKLRLSDRSVSSGDLPECPDDLQPLGDGSLLLISSDRSLWFGAHDEPPKDGNLVAAHNAATYATQSNGRIEWVRNDLTLQLDGRLRRVTFTPSGDRLIAVSEAREGERLVRFSRESSVGQPLTEFFERIESFAISPDGKEIVLSARRSGNDDVGILSAEGGDVRWIAPDPASETMVTWAPRGSKVSYVVTTSGGSLIRTVHVPTGYPLVVDFPLGSVSDFAWEPKAEKFAVVTSSLSKSDHVQLLRYGGESRETLVEPDQRTGAEADPLGTTGWVIAPRSVRYGEKYPLVVATEVSDPFRWRDLLLVAENQRVGLVLVKTDLEGLNQDFWRLATALAWVDPGLVYVISSQPVSEKKMAALSRETAGALKGSIHLVGPVSTGAGPAGTKRIRLLSVKAEPDADVESNAGAVILDDLRGRKRE